jgi:hypothetical protein
MVTPDPPEPTLPLRARTGIVIPVIDNGDHRTVGLMQLTESNGLEAGIAVVLLMTPDEARYIAAELVSYANRLLAHLQEGNRHAHHHRSRRP